MLLSWLLVSILLYYFAAMAKLKSLSAFVLLLQDFIFCCWRFTKTKSWSLLKLHVSNFLTELLRTNMRSFGIKWLISPQFLFFFFFFLGFFYLLFFNVCAWNRIMLSDEGDFFPLLWKILKNTFVALIAVILFDGEIVGFITWEPGRNRFVQ